ncbi:DUF2759 domain-containing protein [Salisediminibacterium selenitireducens]|uniref:Alkaliphily related protein n=1 Tax=Bacillus selenitireducens (strain ATCC 700615 / DSM 15326 / MLS10) TaxID=439292 RepID=D6XW51_BACIE|nr:DUF2759 domain-containing protein [Salisediminibacterium selenitireducens]ADH99805.1 hypothetical protein Bsel_2302 [[Bacillus] selenitireducens MLS10]
MFLGILTLLVAILSLIGGYRELKKKNFFAVGFAALSVALFGWFSIRTLISIIFTGGGGTV